MTEEKQRAKQALNTAVEPFINAIRAAGYNVEYHSTESFLHYTVGIYATITKKELPTWRSNISIEAGHHDGKVRTLSLKAECIRTVVYRTLERLPVVIEKLGESVAHTIKRQENYEKQNLASNAFDVQREKEFEGWTVPPCLRGYGEEPQYRLWSIRPDSMHTLGRYNLDFRAGTFGNLTAAQIKALAAFVTDVLPTVK